MKTINLIAIAATLALLHAGCTKEVQTNSPTGSKDTVYIDQVPVEYNNDVRLIFSLKGEYTMYDVESGLPVYSRHKEKSAWLGEGYDTVNITLPDTVVTYWFEAGTGETETTVNTFEDTKLYKYLLKGGWDVQEEDEEGLM